MFTHTKTRVQTMPTKTKKKATKKKGIVPEITESAMRIWLAGVGAMSLAEEEGLRLFDTLVEKGEAYRDKNKRRLDDAMAELGEAKENATDALGRLTAPLEDGMTSALHGLGVPTRKEISTLTKRVEELTRSVERSKRKPRKQTKAKKRPEPVNA
jgi:poly(hydroxyalkanoate) granule-associated protein